MIAFNRFGLGAKGRRPASIRNAKELLAAEIETPDIAEIISANLPSYAQACQAVNTTFEQADDIKEIEITARIMKHAEVEVGFVERLVLFFSNHFSMSVMKSNTIRATIGQLERDVIRRNVLGSFGSMLLGIMQHPAMLEYLDNASSVGPNSEAGLKSKKGLNQNLAREILELHTLGVTGGYSQKDVEALSLALTGWSYVRGWEADKGLNGGNAENRGQFIFRPGWHEPGPRVVLEKSYSQDGAAQAVAILGDLAIHPSTAQHLAYKLVRHFITDEPTPEMVAPLAAAFLRSGGNIKAMARALINLDVAWRFPMTKLRTPYELQIAKMRALGKTYPGDAKWPFYRTVSALNHRPWERLSPDGFPDDTSYWLAPDAIRLRLETAQMNVGRLLELMTSWPEPSRLAQKLFGKSISKATERAVRIASTPQVGLTTLFMSPEFQRR